MLDSGYLMENDHETIRLDLKTDAKIVEKQALWAGIEPGMRVADLGFGAGKTTLCLHKLVQGRGETVGVDFVEDRIIYARKHYNSYGINYIHHDIREPMRHLGEFDFVWVRFVLEYYRSQGFDIVKNISKILKPGGILCLIDLDHNCLNHYGIPERLEKSFYKLRDMLQITTDFDPYAGRKLYTYLYELGYYEINVDLAAHHLIYGEFNEIDKFNWSKKLRS